MTSDAKVGLLLGLVFIFIIAFVLNGMPRFRDAANNSELTLNMVNKQKDNLGIGTRERKAQEFVDSRQQNSESAFEEIQVPTESTEDIRYTMELPKNMYPEEVTSNEEIAEKDEPVSYNPFEPIVSASVVEEQPEVEQPKPVVKPAAPKFYIVGEGDNLSDIAKKFYGELEGNRLKNVTLIFEANKKILKSPDDIVVGQKLVIPSLKISMNERGSSLSNSLFETVKSIGKRPLSTGSPTVGKAIQGEYYVVKDGDSLWRIADKELGNGGRYSEISKLNADILKDEDNLVIGMRLKMPAR